MPTDRPNVPVPDELAATREEIKRLEAREAVLKQILLSDPSARTGANWLAEIKVVAQERVDWKELRAMHKDLVAEYAFPTEITRVELRGIDAETGEIIPARRYRQATESHQP